MPNTHEPDAQFVEKLEWQLRGDLRRHTRHGSPRRRIRVAKIAALIAVSVSLGAGAMGASQQIAESWRRDLTKARLAVQHELAEQRLRMQMSAAAQSQEQVRQGILDDLDLQLQYAQLQEARADVTVRGLDLEEFGASGLEPRDELSAPLVDGRDFVSERIRIRMDVDRRHLAVVKWEEARTLERFEVGVATELEVQERNLATHETQLQLEALERQLEIRQSYLGGDVSPVEAELMALENETRARIALLERQRQYRGLELQRVQRAIELGSQSLDLAVQIQRFAEVRAQLGLAEAELDIVRRELARRANER